MMMINTGASGVVGRRQLKLINQGTDYWWQFFWEITLRVSTFKSCPAVCLPSLITLPRCLPGGGQARVPRSGPCLQQGPSPGLWFACSSLSLWDQFRVVAAVELLSHVQLCDPHGLQLSRLLHPWDFPVKNAGVGFHFLLQGVFPTRDQTRVSWIGRQVLYHWATWEAWLQRTMKTERQRHKTCIQFLNSLWKAIFEKWASEIESEKEKVGNSLPIPWLGLWTST